MAALEYLAKAGLTVEAVAGKLRASPADRLTPEIREFIGANKATLLAELQAANQQAHGLDRDRLRTNMQALGKLLGMTPKELVTCGVIELEDYPQLAAMTPDVVRALAQVSAERLGVCIKVA